MQASVDAGYAISSGDMSDRILNKPRVQTALVRALEEAGIGDAALARAMVRGLKAKKVIYHQGVPVAEDPDYYARHQYLRTILEVRGDVGSGATRADDESWEEAILTIRRRRSSAPAIDTVSSDPIDVTPTTADEP